MSRCPRSGYLETEAAKTIALAAGEGADARLFSGRSFRVGGATELHAVGADELTIRLLGRWSSDIARIYTRVCTNNVLQLSALMAGAPSHPAVEDVVPSYVQPGA